MHWICAQNSDMNNSDITANFNPTIWDEDIIPEEAINYGQCEVCTPKSRIIWGEGNPAGEIVIVLDNPGEREDKEGREYICGTRQTLQIGLHEAGISHKDVYLTYLLKCRPRKKYDKDAARFFSLPFLKRQIKTLNPKVVLCLGDVVAQSILNNRDAHVKDLRGKLHEIMDYPTIISYHPLAVRRRPNLKKNFMEDLKLLALTSIIEKDRNSQNQRP